MQAACSISGRATLITASSPRIMPPSPSTQPRPTTDCSTSSSCTCSPIFTPARAFPPSNSPVERPSLSRRQRSVFTPRFRPRQLLQPCRRLGPSRCSSWPSSRPSFQWSLTSGPMTPGSLVSVTISTPQPSKVWKRPQTRFKDYFTCKTQGWFGRWGRNIAAPAPANSPAPGAAPGGAGGAPGPASTPARLPAPAMSDGEDDGDGADGEGVRV